ncbi:hypothetical protein GQ53DRAFT_693535 [Thozetella sp. PMI_491]|nr:hypothetical protein GQ53DRAFT_693535 [Thozetella sp. PMI_491]
MRPLAEDITTIPKILHQTWKSDVLPAKFEAWSMSCRLKHPDWEWVLWTNEDNLDLVRLYYPSLMKTYQALPAEIYRADLIRSLYMYTFGGVYLDLDTECLQPSEVLFDKYVVPQKKSHQTALIGRMGVNPEFQHSIPNAWMASPPAHPFHLVLPDTVHRRTKDNEIEGAFPEALTGPIALRDSIVAYESQKVLHGGSLSEGVHKLKAKVPFPKNQTFSHQVTLLPSEFIYPYSWGADGKPYQDLCWVLRDGYDAAKCKAALRVEKKGSVCITYWSHTHTPNGEHAENIKHIT